MAGYYTRAQVEDDLGLSSSERLTFERAGIIGPLQRRERGDTRPLLYTAADLGVARAAMRAHHLGLRGEPLRRVVDALRAKQKRLVDGWSGLLVVDADGDVSLIADGQDVAGDLVSRGSFDAVLVVRVSVPSTQVDTT